MERVKVGRRDRGREGGRGEIEEENYMKISYTTP